MLNENSAYLTVQKNSIEGRELEATALLNLAQSLQVWQESDIWDTGRGSEQLDETLRRNQKLWTIFQVELENPGHPMPAPLKLNLLRLIRYVDTTTFLLLSRPQKERLQSLIELNRTIAEGLLSNLAPPPELEQTERFAGQNVEIEF
jgi:flagellar protein FlaF